MVIWSGSDKIILGNMAGTLTTGVGGAGPEGAAVHADSSYSLEKASDSIEACHLERRPFRAIA